MWHYVAKKPPASQSLPLGEPGWASLKIYNQFKIKLPAREVVWGSQLIA
jgi:hypothetical protein